MTPCPHVPASIAGLQYPRAILPAYGARTVNGTATPVSAKIKVDKGKYHWYTVFMRIERIWAMPNKWTFTIKPIKELLQGRVFGQELGRSICGAKFTG